jgi:ATP-dependent protease HslVU (ClpYQ) peptidase subunit
MTCIVGLAVDGDVYMGGDSAGVMEYTLSVRADAKVFRRERRAEPWVFGFAGSFRLGDILRYHLTLPESPPDEGDVRAYLVTEFIPAVRAALRDHGVLRKQDEEELGQTFLVGLRGRLYSIHDDFQVGENVLPYAAIGSGAEVALGSLYSTQDRQPEDRVRLALAAAEQFCNSVRGPFHVVSLRTDPA